MPTNGGRPYIGSSDFMQLFSRTARWSAAAKRVSVFKLYGEWVDGVASKPQLRRVVVDLRRRGIALAIETGPLDPTAECGEGVEGFSTVAAGVHMARRIKAAGGVLSYVALDEPFFYANRYQGRGACGWSAERVAQGVAAFVRAIREIFPGVQVGDTEPVTSAGDAAAYVGWLDAYRGVSGETFAFLHLDMSYSLRNWRGLARGLEAASRARSVPFGLIGFGEPTARSDAEWTSRARGRIESYEVDAGGTPDHVVFQSWQDRPNRTLPDTSPYTFSGLVRAYARPRTRLTLSLAPRASHEVSVLGRLRTAGGKPVPRARVNVSVGIAVEGEESLILARTTASTNARGAFAAVLTKVPETGFEITARYAGSNKLWPARAKHAEGEALSNVALGRPATAGAELPSNPPSFAVDGDPETLWIAGTGPPMWIEIDFGTPVRVVEVHLHVAQTPNGSTTHAVLALTGTGWVKVADIWGDDGQRGRRRTAVVISGRRTCCARRDKSEPVVGRVARDRGARLALSGYAAGVVAGASSAWRRALESAYCDGVGSKSTSSRYTISAASP
jgi:hypothetical protein